MRNGLRKQVTWLNNVYMPQALDIGRGYVRDAIGDDIRDEFLNIADEMVTDVETLHELAAERHTGDWAGLVKDTLGIDLAGIIDEEDLAESLELFSDGTAGLIKKISGELAGDISRVTVDAFKEGLSHSELAKKLALEYNEVLHGKHVGRTEESRKRNMARKRALLRRQKDPTKGTGLPYRYQSRYELIARDQTAKLTAHFNRVRMQQGGIERYEWFTSLDERVRDSHRVKHGKHFSFEEPPRDTGHPGDDVQCRCLAMGVVE